ncbi:MBL fold metallo-hydrolase [Alkalibaculum sporogenes]|nr:MBL fold metallo-hydrolase [Alkalibaculum sporogenes]
MKLTVLGNNGPYPTANGACSGYLIEHDDTKILLDCGNGVMSNLLNVCDIMKLDAIILTHLHPDHISDIFIMRYALQRKGIQIPLYAPSSPSDEYKRLEYKNVFDICEIYQDLKLTIGQLSITFREFKHVLRNYGICIETENKKFVYTGDMIYDENIIEFASNSDVLLIEAGVLHRDLKFNPPHLSAKQACEIGKKSKVKKLFLTHFNPEYTIDEYIKESINQFDGLLVLATIMKTYQI